MLSKVALRATGTPGTIGDGKAVEGGVRDEEGGVDVRAKEAATEEEDEADWEEDDESDAMVELTNDGAADEK